MVLVLLLWNVIIRLNLCFVLHLDNVGSEFQAAELTQILLLLFIEFVHVSARCSAAAEHADG